MNCSLTETCERGVARGALRWSHLQAAQGQRRATGAQGGMNVRTELMGAAAYTVTRPTSLKAKPARIGEKPARASAQAGTRTSQRASVELRENLIVKTS